MKHIDTIKELMKQSASIKELIIAIRQSEIPAVYTRYADKALKKKHGIKQHEKWHRFFVETSLTPVNKWENLSNYSTVLISDDLQEMKVIDKS